MYEVFYYAAPAMDRKLPCFDTGIADSAIRAGGSHLAPEAGGGYAEARNSSTGMPTLYGWDGRWHAAPPDAAAVLAKKLGIARVSPYTTEGGRLQREGKL